MARLFLEDVQMHLDVKAEDVSFLAEWERDPLKEAKGQSLIDYITPYVFLCFRSRTDS
jgi:hypothetical protein